MCLEMIEILIWMGVKAMNIMRSLILMRVGRRGVKYEKVAMVGRRQVNRNLRVCGSYFPRGGSYRG